MSTINTVLQTGSQLITNYDLTQMFLGANRYKKGTIQDVAGAGLTLKAGTLLGKVTVNTGTVHACQQVATATILGSIRTGVLQVATVTVVGTIGSAGAGNAKAIVTGALVGGSPLTVEVAVANNDTASQVASKVKTALNISAITNNYIIGGAGAVITLTANLAATNDATLNIEVKNDTCSGLTDATSTITTEGVATGAGYAQAIITGLLVSGTPLTISEIAVADSDTAAEVASKVKTALDISAITNNYIIGGAGAVITLTANLAATNDATLNIEVKNNTCVGLTDINSTITTEGQAAGADTSVVGNLVPFISTGTNGQTMPVGILAQDITIAPGDGTKTYEGANYCIGGDFDYGKLIFFMSGDTLDTVITGSEAVRELIFAQTTLVGVTITQLTGLDNQ